MGSEIERKFLVRGELPLEGVEGSLQRQGYLAINERGTVRMRIEGGRAVLGIKSAQKGLTRREYEYEVPLADGEEMLAELCGLVVEKTRYRIEHAGHVWDVDVFHGANEGLVTAEVELESEEEEVQLPEWVGEDVSLDVRYRVAYLSRHAWPEWAEDSSPG
jgi:CYTH domain-containing protein